MKAKRIFYKNFIAIICSLVLICCAPMSVLAAGDLTLVPYLGFSQKSQDFIIAPMNHAFLDASVISNYPGDYSGEFTVIYSLWCSDNHSRLVSYMFVIDQPYSIGYFTSSGIAGFTGGFGISMKEAKLMDSVGNTFLCVPASDYTRFNDTLPSGNVSMGTTAKRSMRLMGSLRDAVISPCATLTVTYSVQANVPLSHAILDAPVLSRYTGSHDAPVFSELPASVSDSSKLDQINDNLNDLKDKTDITNSNLNDLKNKTDVTNNKLENLTNGYDSSSLDLDRMLLKGSMNEYNNAEDQVISTATDYFKRVYRPVYFFNGGTFLTSTSFIFTYLQGIYSHLGSAQVVVDVVLALTVAFSFIGLGRYIWRRPRKGDG